MRVINLTGHEISLDGFPLYPSGWVARVKSDNLVPFGKAKREEVGRKIRLIETKEVEGDEGTVKLYVGTVSSNLPKQRRGIIYVVSTMVRMANPDRLDLYSPLTRREEGKVVCVGLVCNVAPIEMDPKRYV